MPSFISDSDRSGPRRPDRFTILLLGSLLIILASLEIVTRARLDSTSKVHRLEMAQRNTLLAVRDTGAANDPHLALLGNSLMLEGTDLRLFRAKLTPKYVPVPYFVLGTNYYDWYFGLKRLFAEGMRPRYVLLGLSPNQLATSEVRGDISARYLVQQSDLLELVQRTHMDATRASEFMLAHYSQYYSTRETIRSYVIARVLPNVGEMFHNQNVSLRDPAISESVLSPLAVERLGAMDKLCKENGAHFVLVVPPTYQSGAEVIAAAGRKAGIDVLLPVKSNEFDASDYQEDGFHLNSKGSEIFTSRLAESLNEVLPQ